MYIYPYIYISIYISIIYIMYILHVVVFVPYRHTTHHWFHISIKMISIFYLFVILHNQCHSVMVSVSVVTCGEGVLFLEPEPPTGMRP